MTARPVVSVDARLAEIERMVYIAARQVENISDSPSPVVVTWLRELLPEVRWLLSQLRDARAENERLIRDRATNEKVNIASRRSLCEQRDRYLASWQSAELKASDYNEEIVAAHAERDALRARLAAAERAQRVLIDLLDEHALAAAEQDEPKRCEHGFGEAHDFGFMASQWCPGPSRPTEGATE